MDIKSSIRILYQLGTNIKWISETSMITLSNRIYLERIEYLDEYFKTAISYPTSVSGICQNFLIINACSFIDEYENYFTYSNYPEEKDRILKFKKIVLPAYRQIKSWKDLKSLRNHIIAHNHRIKVKSIFDYKEKTTYNVPTTNGEYRLLADLIFLITTNINDIFPEMRKEEIINKTLMDYLNFKSDIVRASEEYKRIKMEIEYIKKSIT